MIEKMSDAIVYDVDSVSALRLLIRNSPDVTFDDPSLRQKIMKDMKSSDFVRYGKKIGSLIIVSADLIDDNYLKEKLGW